ncbi:hypothetical protein AURDEDRAFT_149397 [Auricularia subglabra TFB-10046 SS5]|nr:hypothetical protein AURDEDRAFT_149397 [Auricularia subglabra TFB-10046 SS5]
MASHSQARLPSELWLRILEEAAAWDPDYVDIEFLREGQRNPLLLDCALVSKQWYPLALRILFREVLVGMWDYFDEDGKYYGQTIGPLQHFTETLARLTRAGSDLPRSVQVLHLCIGLKKPRDASYDRYVYPDFGSVARAVKLCPNLRHLSLRVHCEPAGRAWTLPPHVLHAFAGARHLEQLTYTDQQDFQTMSRLRTVAAVRAAGGGEFAVVRAALTLRPLFQLLGVLPGIQQLNVSALDAEGSGGQHENLHLPHLRELRIPAGQTTRQLLHNSPPGLETVIFDDIDPTAIAPLPTTALRALIMRGDHVPESLARFTNLEHVGIEYDFIGTLSLRLLETMPASVTRLTFYGEVREHSLHVEDGPMTVDLELQHEVLDSEQLLDAVTSGPLRRLQRLTVVLHPGLRVNPSTQLLERLATNGTVFEMYGGMHPRAVPS